MTRISARFGKNLAQDLARDLCATTAHKIGFWRDFKQYSAPDSSPDSHPKSTNIFWRLDFHIRQLWLKFRLTNKGRLR
ncbi:hypothetical protein BKN38_07445 [Helicobacter sp. CLO-3]|nr:hypothetical protein BA723_07085 [Helicobacter sp. CLO-3]OHU82263.1 hypothetical protein BKN38_07445 [Helicobacter sp. CLO-3]